MTLRSIVIREPATTQGVSGLLPATGPPAAASLSRSGGAAHAGPDGGAVPGAGNGVGTRLEGSVLEARSACGERPTGCKVSECAHRQAVRVSFPRTGTPVGKARSVSAIFAGDTNPASSMDAAGGMKLGLGTSATATQKVDTAIGNLAEFLAKINVMATFDVAAKTQELLAQDRAPGKVTTY